MSHYVRVACSEGGELGAVEHAINTAITAGFFIDAERVSISEKPDEKSRNAQLVTLEFMQRVVPVKPPDNSIGEEAVAASDAPPRHEG